MMAAEGTLMWKEIMEEPEALRACRDGNRQALDAVVSEIRRRGIRQIAICARGTSDHAAIYGKYVFEVLTGIPVMLVAPSVLTMYRRDVDLKNALVIGISQSGQTEDVSEVIRAARRQGALTVGISNVPDSPLLQCPEYALHCNAGPEKSIAATKTFLAEMYLLLLLGAALSGNPEAGAELLAVPGGLNRLYQVAEAVRILAQRYRFVDGCFVLARGLNYPVALEAALKIQETAYVRAQAFAISDFYHGPIALVQEGTPIILFAPKGPSFQEAAGFIERIQDRGADTLVISDDAEICRRGSASLQIPVSGGDLITPFYNAAAVQMLACQIAAVRGNNPDKPRGLQKVVATG